MNRLEEALKNKKDEIDLLEAPADLESRLRNALNGRKRRSWYKPVAAVIVAALLFTYNFDTMAYFAKKITGYDQIAIGSLRQFTEEGKGQQIGRSCTFSNGVEITIDGIMFDENELVAFYKVRSSAGKVLDILDYNLPRLHIYGIRPGGYMVGSGTGTKLDDQTMTFVDTFETPAFYEKWMKFSVELIVNNKPEVRYIDFTLDRNQAMKRTAKINLKAEAKLGDYRILFDKLTASTMSTAIEGRIIPLNAGAMKVFQPETPEESGAMPQLRFDIASDDGEVTQLSGGQGTAGDQISFNCQSDALPKDFKTLKIRNIRMETSKFFDKTLELGADTRDLKVSDDLTINSIYKESDEICVTMSSRGIPVAGLFKGDKELEQVRPNAYDLEPESSASIQRVYRFKAGTGTLENLKLSVKYIRYARFSADTIDIPIGS